MTYTRHSHVVHGDRIWIYDKGYLQESISIFPQWNAVDWCIRHGMELTEQETTEDGQTFNIYKRGRELAAAIPE